MTNTFAKTRTKLMVMLMVLAIVALVASIAITAFSSADADEIFTPVTDAYELQQELDKRPSGTIFKLQKDITPTSSITVSSTVTIDLNGYEIRYANSSSTAAAAPVITVTGGTLTLKDSANDSASDHTISYRGSNVKIDGGLVTGGKAGGVLVSGGSFIFEGGTIAGNSSSTDTNGGGVTMKAAANTFIMKSGATISHNSALMGGGVFVLGAGSNSFSMEGGRIANNTATMNGGGVYLTGGQGILLEVKGGEISSNTATNGKGGGIYVDKSITAVISNNTPAPKIDANSAPNGGGMYVAGTLTMTGGLFSLNATTNHGAGIYADGGTLNISGGEISNNKASYGNGAGVYMTNNSTVTLTNATIRANTITGYGNGAGVYMENGTFTMSSGSIISNTITGNGTGAGVYFNAGTLTLRGTPVINENKVAGGKASNLQLVGSSTFVTVTAAISANAKIGISVDSARTFTSGYGKFNKTVNGFFSDDTSRSTSLTSTGTDAELKLAERVVVSVIKDNGEAEYFADIEKAWATISGPYTFRVQLRADVETSKPLVVSAKAVILDLNGHMIRYTGEISDPVMKDGADSEKEVDQDKEKEFNRAQSVIVILPTATAPNISFTLTDSRPTASSHEIVDMAHSIFPKASEDEKDAIPEDPTIVTVNIFGGLIAGGRNGIYFDNDNRNNITFAFEAGTIAGAKYDGLNFLGAPSNNVNDVATLSSAAAIRYNGQNGITANGYQTVVMNGGDVSFNGNFGVYIADTTPLFTMNGGRINNNVSVGLRSYGVQNEINAGDISYNGYGKSGEFAVGIALLSDNATLTITSGTISHNNNTGIWSAQVENSKLYMTGGEISYNRGFGLHLYAIEAEISNATISYNTSRGLQVHKKLTVTDSTICYNGNDNVQLSSGGNAVFTNTLVYKAGAVGIRVSGGELTLNGGKIYGNTHDGVALVSTNAKFNFNDGEVYENGYGGIYVGYGHFEMNGGVIHHSTASPNNNRYGGGLSLLVAGDITIALNKGKIYSNTATNGGGINISALSGTTATVDVTIGEEFEIYNNKSTQYGGGIRIQNDSNKAKLTVTMAAGSIYGNETMYGGGVYLASSLAPTDTAYTKLVLTGGEIKENKATYGGGIYYGVNGIVEMSDLPYVKENTLLDGKTASNLYVAGDQRVKITGEIKYAEKEEKIGLTVEGAYYGKVLTEDYYVQAYKNTSIKGFYMDDANLGKVGTGTWQKDSSTSQMELILDVQGIVAVGKWNSSASSNSEKFELLDKKGSWDEAYAAVTKGENGANALQLLADVGVMKTVSITSSVTLDLNGHMLQSGTGDYLLPLILLDTGTSATLTITDSTYAVGANGVSTASGTHWFIDPTTEKWAELRGGVVHGLVQVNGGKLEFDAGYIVNGANLATPATDKKQHSAGVWVEGGEFVMTDSNNAAVYYNRSSGILHYGGKTTINGGRVSYNYSQYYGGGMVVGATDCTINGGELCYNLAGVWGGAIDMYQTSGVAQALTLNGGSIHDNVVRGWKNTSFGAGGIQVQSSSAGSTLTINGGSIINNRVESNGYKGAMNGGLGLTYGSLSGTAQLVLNGGTVVIEGNTVDGVENNLQLNQGKLLNISKAFSAGSRIGVSLPNESSASSTYVFTENYTSAGNGSTFLPFFADDPTNCLTYAEASGPYSAHAGELVLNAHLPQVSATMQHFNLTMPSCKDKKDGSPEYWKCTLCDRKFVSIEPSFVDFDEERDIIPWEHNFTSFSYYSPTKHRAYCSDCNAYEELDHVFSDWMASGVGQHSSTCSVCTREITEKCAYEGAENRNSNATTHWQECPTCGTHYEEAAHEVVAGTYTRLDDNRHVGTCKDCGYAEVTASHTPDGKYVEKNAQEHYQTCTGCHQAVNTEAHTLVELAGDDPDSTTFECQFCHYQSTTADHKRGQLTFDKDGHYYPCEMHPGEKLGAASHELAYSWDNKGNGKHTVSCATCGWKETNVDCSYGTEYEVEGDYHYRKCSECGAKDSADQNGTKHTPKYMFDSNQHWYECTECHTITTAKASHVWENAYDKEQHFQRCADHEKGCDVMRNVTPHEFDSTDWQINDNEHWQKCTGCDFETDKIKHVTTTVKGENGHHEQCTECGWTGQEVEHKWLDGYRSNSNGHFYRCEVCGYDQAPQAHDYEGQQYTYVGGATGQHSILCRVCNYKFTETCVNVYQDKTATTHTATCEKCGNSEGPKEHSMRFGSNQTQHWDVCADCGYGSNGETAKTDHNWNSEGNCSICGKPSNDPLDGPRVQAKNNLEQKANEAKAALKGASAGTYEGLIDSVLLNATLDIDSAMSQDEIDSIIERALADFIENVVKNRKIYAGEQLDAEQQNILENNLPEGITDEERTRYEQAIAAAKAAALADVNAGSDLDTVDGALAAGIEAMNKAVLNTAKKIAQEKVRDQAQAKKDEIDQKVENGELTPEQGEDLKDIIDKEAGRAEDNIENADSFDEVNEEQKRGDDVMQDVVDNPDLAEDKSKGRDDLEDEANKKKDDIQKKADQEKDDVQKKADEDKKDVDNDPTLSDDEKEQKKDEIQQEADRKKDEIQQKADEQKKGVDDAKKDAENKVTDAKTPEEVKDAVDQGKNSIDKVGSTTDPAKGSFLDWFKNNPLPLGIAAITLGAMLFIIIILSIAARKRKTK